MTKKTFMLLLTASLVACSLAAPPRAVGGGYEEGLEKLLPPSGGIEGWTIDGERLIYYADDLWEYINGAAEGFLAYGVKAVVVQDYLGESGAGLKLEIYDHETPLMGFGIYSQHRGPGLRFVDVGAEGFSDEYSLQCWKGRYFVKINVYEANEKLSKAMMRFAEAVTAAIPGDASFPGELGAFPREGLVAESLAYLTEGVLGRGRFPHAFAGDYELDDSSGRLYLFPAAGGSGEAEALAAWYAGETGAALEAASAGEAEYRWGAGKDPYQGEVAIFTAGSWAGVVTGFENNPAVRREIVERVARTLPKLGTPAPPEGARLVPE